MRMLGHNFGSDWATAIYPLIDEALVNRSSARLITSQSKPDFTNPHSLHNKPNTTPDPIPVIDTPIKASFSVVSCQIGLK